MRYAQTSDAVPNLIARAKSRLLQAEKTLCMATIRKEIADRIHQDIQCRLIHGFQSRVKLELDIANLEIEIYKLSGISRV